MKLSKRLGSVIIALAILASSMSAFACGSDYFIAYDQYGEIQKGELVYSKLFYCPEKDTVVKKGVAETAEWKTVFYEAEYPHKRIEALFLDGTNTGLTRWNENWAQPYAIVNTKEVPEFWEAKVPYFVYNRIYSDFTGKFEPTNTLTTNYKSAPVAKEWVNRGFENIAIENGVTKDYSAVYARANNQVAIQYNLDQLNDAYEMMLAYGASYDLASRIFTDLKPQKVYDNFERDIINELGAATYAIIEPVLKSLDEVKNVSWLKLTGPDYVTGGDMVVEPMAKIAAGSAPDWYDNLIAATTPKTKSNTDLAKLYQNEYADITWVTVGHELKAPYRYYQVLSINGVLMDGSEVELAGTTVDRLETIDTLDNQFAIQFVKKDIEPTSVYEYSVKEDYVVNPFDTTRYKTIREKVEFEVVESEDTVDEVVDAAAYDGQYIELDRTTADEFVNGNLVTDNVVYDVEYTRNERETVLSTVVTPTGEEFEVRLAKVVREPGKTNLPYIYRLIGCAQPEVEWRIAFAERAYPYEIYEEKFVKNEFTGEFVATEEYRTTGKYAEPQVVLDQTMSQPRVLKVTLKDTTDRTKLEWALKEVGFPYILEGDSVTAVVDTKFYWNDDLGDFVSYEGYLQTGDVQHDFEEFVNFFSYEIRDEYPLEIVD